MQDDETTGYVPHKFEVRHHRRGDLVDGEAFPLVPTRDPAAIVALLAYAAATPDGELGDYLRAWVRRTRQDSEDLNEHGPIPGEDVEDLVPSWVATLSGKVRTGDLGVEAALFRIARWTREALT